MVTILRVLESSLSKAAGDFASINIRVKWQGGSGGMQIDSPVPNFHSFLKADG